MEERYLTPEQVAERLSVRPKSVRKWLRMRRLKGVKVGRLWRISAEDLGAFLMVPGKPPEKPVARRGSALGFLADLPGFGSEESMTSKQEERDRGEEKWRERHRAGETAPRPSALHVLPTDQLDEKAEAERKARVKAARGMFRHVPFSSEDLIGESREEVEREEQRWAERRGQ